MKFCETFNPSKLKYLLEHKEEFKCRVYDESYNPYAIPQKYLARSSNGKITVNYHQTGNRDFGRFFADKGLSLQSMSRQIRHTIAKEFYNDLDIVNCHPVLLLAKCKMHDIDCNYLNDYIVNRETHIADLIAAADIDRDAAKIIFLSILNNGFADYDKLKKKTKFLKRYKREMTDILDEITELYPSELNIRTKSHPDNPKGSTVNAILCEMENSILQLMIKFYKSIGLIKDDCVMCFDGIMIPKSDDVANSIDDCISYLKKHSPIVNSSEYFSLKIKLMDEGFNLPDDIPQHIEYEPFDPRDEFCWLEFDEKWRGHTFASLDDVINKTSTDLNRVFCRIEQGSGLIVKKSDCEDNLHDIIDRNSNFTDLYFTYCVDDDKTKEISFKRYLQIFSNLVKRYRSIDFNPASNDPKLFNLWSGFKAELQKNTEDDLNKIQLILSHIREVYCNDDLESYNYFLDLLYYILKYPGKPLGVATFLYSNKQGSGKNVILDFLQEFVFGATITHYTTGLDNILEKHNHMLKNKKIAVVDELASSSENFMSNFDKLKSMMTGPSIVVNPKGVNQYSIKNVLCWFLISNNDDCLRIEPSDRRYFCLNVSEKYVGNKSYFKSLVDSFSVESGNIFYSYILERGDDREINIRIPPMNKFKREIISRGWSSSVRFLFEKKEIFDNPISISRPEELPHDSDDDDDAIEMPAPNPIIAASSLYNEYKAWCDTNHERKKSNTKFSNDIKTKITKTRTRTGMVYDMSTVVF